MRVWLGRLVKEEDQVEHKNHELWPITRPPNFSETQRIRISAWILSPTGLRPDVNANIPEVLSVGTDEPLGTDAYDGVRNLVGRSQP